MKNITDLDVQYGIYKIKQAKEYRIFADDNEANFYHLESQEDGSYKWVVSKEFNDAVNASLKLEEKIIEV